MKSRTTTWLVGMAVALFLFIVLVERRADRLGDRRTDVRLLAQLDPQAVTTLHLRHGTNEPVALERGTNSWFFREPLLYPAQPESVVRFLTRLGEVRERGRVRPEEVGRQVNGLAAFGLAPPAATITLGSQDERTTVNLGSPTAIGGQIYAQVVGQSDLVTLEAKTLELLPTTFDAWRDRTLLNLGATPFDRLQVRPLTNGFEVVRESTGRAWQMTKPWPTRANSARLEFLLQELSLVRIASFVRDAPTAEDLVAYGLQPAQRELVFARGTNEVMALQVGLPAPGDTNLVYVRSSTYGNVVLANRIPLGPWLETSRDFYTQFCDRRLMVFDLDQVDRLVIQAEETFSVERSVGERWRITEPFAAPADTVLLLEALAELASLEFLALERAVATEFASYGLAPPRRSYRIEHTATRDAGPTNEVVAQVDFGNASGHRYFARRLLEDSVVLALDPVRLPRAAFQLRERHLWNISTNDVAAITVSQGQQVRRTVRTGPMQWALADGAGGAPNPVTMEEAAYLLGQLRAERWVAVGEAMLPRYGFSEGGARVTLEQKTGREPAQLEVRFGSTSPAGRLYAATVLTNQPGPVIFECPPRLREFVLNDLSFATPVPVPAPASAPPPPGS